VILIHFLLVLFYLELSNLVFNALLDLIVELHPDWNRQERQYGLVALQILEFKLLYRFGLFLLVLDCVIFDLQLFRFKFLVIFQPSVGDFVVFSRLILKISLDCLLSCFVSLICLRTVRPIKIKLKTESIELLELA